MTLFATDELGEPPSGQTRPMRLHRRHARERGMAIKDLPYVAVEKCTASVTHEGIVYDFWYTSNSSKYPERRLQHYVERLCEVTEVP